MRQTKQCAPICVFHGVKFRNRADFPNKISSLIYRTEREKQQQQRKCLFIYHHSLNTLSNQFRVMRLPLQMETILAHANSLTLIRHRNFIQFALRFSYCIQTGHAIKFTLFFQP